MIVVVIGVVAACNTGGHKRPRPDSEPHGAEAAPFDGPRFDGARAHADLVHLAEYGELQTGSRAAGKARAHLRRVLKQADFEARDVTTEIAVDHASGEVTAHRATHVLGRRKGSSRDAILLVSPYTTHAPDGDASAGAGDASGASVLLEIARLAQAAHAHGGTPPFTLLLAFIDGDGLGLHAPGASPAQSWPGSDAFAAWFLEHAGGLDLRLVVFIDRVGGSGVEVARDLRSSRAYRETFFEIGEEHGLEPAFTTGRPLSAPEGGHEALLARGFEPLVALIGELPRSEAIAMERGTAPGSFSTSTLGLAGVGEATWLGVSLISDRLARIDAFEADPLSAGPSRLALPGAEEPAGEVETDGTKGSRAPADDRASRKSRAPADERASKSARAPAAPR